MDVGYVLYEYDTVLAQMGPYGQSNSVYGVLQEGLLEPEFHGNLERLLAKLIFGII